MKLLVIEDEEGLREALITSLSGEGYQAEGADNGADGLDMILTGLYDLIILDIMLPRMDGFELVRRIRRVDQQTPVLFLTARSATEDVVAGFELGADDYLKKPFGMRELIVRVQNLVRRRPAQGRPSSPHSPQGGEDRHGEKALLSVGDVLIDSDGSGVYTFGSFLLDATQQRLTHVLTGAVTDLSHREAEILRALCQHRGEVVESRGLLLALWGDDSIWNARSLHVFITKLRHHLHQDPSLRIVNVRGVGYKLLD